MKLTPEEIAEFSNKFERDFIRRLNDLVGDDWDIRSKEFNPHRGDVQDTSGINSNTLLLLWGDERSRVFPDEYVKASGLVVKCYCPESWQERGIIPMTDRMMVSIPDSPILPSSKREYTVMYSANLNYRRTDMYRGLSERSFGYPFRVTSNYPITGVYPLWQKLEAAMVHAILTRYANQMDFSHLYPNSYIRFHSSFMQGSLSAAEYVNRLLNSKISWCTAGFMTNETSRLLESAAAGCVVICGKLPETPMYKGHPFVVVDDWRNIIKVTNDILNDPDRMDELGYKARQWYESHFSPTAQAERIAKTLLQRRR